jgi:hypothetical protein
MVERNKSTNNEREKMKAPIKKWLSAWKTKLNENDWQSTRDTKS